MKYKAGDKVRIKTWEEMEKEYGLCSPHSDYIDNSPIHFVKEMEDKITGLNINRILTIKASCLDYDDDEYYKMKETDNHYTDSMIKCLSKPEKPINSRFELLDLQVEEGQVVEKIKEETWYLINPVKPVDEKMYDIKLKDGTIIENVEFWPFRSVFLYSNGQEVSGRIVEFKEII